MLATSCTISANVDQHCPFWPNLGPIRIRSILVDLPASGNFGELCRTWPEFGQPPPSFKFGRNLQQTLGQQQPTCPTFGLRRSIAVESEPKLASRSNVSIVVGPTICGNKLCESEFRGCAPLSPYVIERETSIAQFGQCLALGALVQPKSG